MASSQLRRRSGEGLQPPSSSSSVCLPSPISTLSSIVSVSFVKPRVFTVAPRTGRSLSTCVRLVGDTTAPSAQSMLSHEGLVRGVALRLLSVVPAPSQDEGRLTLSKGWRFFRQEPGKLCMLILSDWPLSVCSLIRSPTLTLKRLHFLQRSWGVRTSSTAKFTLRVEVGELWSHTAFW